MVKLMDHLNLNHLRVFEAVHRTRSMTKAASELHLTQSGISQHIKALEDSLNLTLFDRHKQKIIPTSVANTLFEKCTDGFNELERTLWYLTESHKQLMGRVKIGLPVEFGNNIVLPLVSDFIKSHPKVRVDITFGLANEMHEPLLDGLIDFAYVDGFSVNSNFTSEKVFDDIYELCATKDYLKDKGKFANTLDFYQTLDYVDYLDGEPVMRMWLNHHVKEAKSDKYDLNVRFTSQNTPSIYHMIQCGLGAGVLPRHLLDKLDKGGKNVERLPGNGTLLVSPISCTYLASRTQSRPAEMLMKFINEKLKSKKDKEKARNAKS